MIGGRDYLIPIDIDPEIDREAWLAERVKGHGGSDVAKILGEHPKEGPIDVWSDHVTGIARIDPDNERTRGGRFFEPYVLQWFADGEPAWPRRGDKYVVAKPPTVYHRDRPWQRGSVDGLAYCPETIASADVPLMARLPDAIIEAKAHGWFGSRGYDLDDDGDPMVSVPPDKRIQVAWYQELYGVEVGYLAALIDTHLKRTFLIPRDRELGAMLLEEVEQFRKRYILTGEMPPPDGKANYRDYLKRRFKLHSAEIVESTSEVDLATEALLAIKRDQARLKDERELAEQVIKRLIGGDAGVRTAHGIVTWKSQRNGKYRDKDMRDALYKVAGWTDLEIAAFEAQYELPDHRVLRTPSTPKGKGK